MFKYFIKKRSKGGKIKLIMKCMNLNRIFSLYRKDINCNVYNETILKFSAI